MLTYTKREEIKLRLRGGVTRQQLRCLRKEKNKRCDELGAREIRENHASTLTRRHVFEKKGAEIVID